MQLEPNANRDFNTAATELLNGTMQFVCQPDIGGSLCKNSDTGNESPKHDLLDVPSRCMIGDDIRARHVTILIA